MFARRLKVAVWVEGRAQPCPLAWLDSFCMRRFTGEVVFDDTLPVADGELEAGREVDRERLARALADWLSKKKGAGKTIAVEIEELPRKDVPSRS